MLEFCVAASILIKLCCF